MYPDNSIRKRKQIDCNACLLGNCVRIDMGKFLSNKIITVKDTCAV